MKTYAVTVQYNLQASNDNEAIKIACEKAKADNLQNDNRCNVYSICEISTKEKARLVMGSMDYKF